MMALKACADAGRWEHALAILEGMKGTSGLFVVGDFHFHLAWAHWDSSDAT